MPDPEIWTMNSKKGWPRIDYDKGIWIPCPDPADDQASEQSPQLSKRLWTVWKNALFHRDSTGTWRRLREKLVNVA